MRAPWQPSNGPNGSSTTHSSPLCPSLSGINTTDAQTLREETARTAKNKKKADMSDTARILRWAAEALERLEAASEKRRDAKVTRAPVEKDIMHNALTKMLTEKEIVNTNRDRHAVLPLVKTSQAEPAYGLGLCHTTSQAAEPLQEPALFLLFTFTLFSID